MQSHVKNLQKITACLLLTLLLFVPLQMQAAVSTSPNYQFSGQIIPVGGQGTSVSFSAQLSSEPNSGSASSSSFTVTGADLLTETTEIISTPSGGGGSSATYITTLNVDTISDTSARLKGKINRSNNWQTYFVISTDADSLTCANTSQRLSVAGVYNDEDDFSLIVTDLQPETSYVARACGVSSSSDRIRQGNDKMFITAVSDDIDDAIVTVPETPDGLVNTSNCSNYLTSYIRLGSTENNQIQVRRLQQYLNIYEGQTLPVDGVYNQDDFEAIKKYQTKYSAEILAPWGLTSPTGYVYKTTTSHINNSLCAKLGQLPVDDDVEVADNPEADLVARLQLQIEQLSRRVLNLLFNQEQNIESENKTLEQNAFDVTPDTCPLYVVSRINQDLDNDPTEVSKLERYLIVYEKEPLVADGVYGLDDLVAVQRYQKKYQDLILAPWGLKNPTGDVYVSTTKHINSVVCGGVGDGVDEELYPQLFDEDYGIFNSIFNLFSR